MGPRKETTEIFSPDKQIKSKKNTLMNSSVPSDKTKNDAIPKKGKSTYKKKHLAQIVKSELDYISNLFDILDLSKLFHGRREEEEDDDGDSEPLMDLPENKILNKQSNKKGSGQSSIKSKSFPQTIEGLEKELELLKGTPMTYQKKLRKKGLQARLTKKKRKIEVKQRKAAMKQAKKGKPVLNSDGNVVSNRFDFADSEMKKENKRKLNLILNETNGIQETNQSKKKKSDEGFSNNLNLVGGLNLISTKKSNDITKNKEQLSNVNSILKSESDSSSHTIKKEGLDVKSNINTQIDANKTVSQGPIFNKENKMVFSKVYLPENRVKSKKKSENNPKKILEKLKEDSKKISELEKEDKEKAVTLKEKQKWAAALKRASGEKVRDDPELLRKSISREKNKKMRSQKKWQSRIDRVEKEKEERQKKRKENLQARKSEKKKKKMKKAIKKGSFVQL